MHIELRFFASVREAVGAGQLSLDIPPQVQTIGQLRTLLRDRGAEWEAALAPGRALRMALNQQMVDESAALMDGGEVAFFPPVTGG